MGTASPTLTRPLMTIPTTKVLQIALVTPLQGPAGIFGPSCEAGRYTNRYGPEAPVLNSMGESCYEGVRLLAALIQRADGLDVPGLCSVADTVGLANVCRRIEEFHKVHGELWEPAPLLVRLAQQGRTFAAWDAERAAGERVAAS